MSTLILYSGNVGTTRTAAMAIAKESGQAGILPRCEPVSNAPSLSGIDTLIIGTPIYYGKWPKEVAGFIRSHADEMKKIRVLLFMTCLRLTRPSDKVFPSLNIHVDPALAEEAKPFSKMGMMEKSHSLLYYLDPILPLLDEAGITRLGFFKGNLDFSLLDLKSRLVMRLMSLMMKQAAPGRFLNRAELCRWALTETSS